MRQFFGAIRDSRNVESETNDDLKHSKQTFNARMLSGFEQFKHPVLILISGRDLTAQEFVDLCKTDEKWSNCLDRPDVSIRHFPDADHTMSDRTSLETACKIAGTWINEKASA